MTSVKKNSTVKASSARHIIRQNCGADDDEDGDDDNGDEDGDGNEDGDDGRWQ
jgi:hypothetical protein